MRLLKLEGSNLNVLEWLTPDILNARRMRDTFKRAKNWQEYKKFRNVTRDLIRKAKKSTSQNR